MSEEEIIKILKHWATTISACDFEDKNRIAEAIQGLLDLYNAEKDKNKKIEETVKEGMKNLWVDTCGEDAGKYSAYMSILRILEGE